jgi:hypothetical protein
MRDSVKTLFCLLILLGLVACQNQSLLKVDRRLDGFQKRQELIQNKINASDPQTAIADTVNTPLDQAVKDLTALNTELNAYSDSLKSEVQEHPHRKIYSRQQADRIVQILRRSIKMNLEIKDKSDILKLRIKLMERIGQRK